MSGEMRGGFPVNDEQAKVIDHLLGQPAARRVTVVGAGAGSGKTYTTVAAVLHLIECRGATADQFILITFTEKAAAELRGRVEQAFGRRMNSAADPAERRVWQGQIERLSAAYVGTIHGFCRQVLRTFGYEERVARGADVTHARSLLRDAVHDAVEGAMLEGDCPLLDPPATWHEYELREFVERVLDQARGRGIAARALLERTLDQPEDPGKRYRAAMAGLVARADELYRGRKVQEQRLDPNDLLALAASLLAGDQGGPILEKITRRYRYLFVDEFQDTDRVQKRIVDCFLGRLDGLLVVGDTKQAIYGWRSAEVSLLSELAKQSGGPILPLSISRRPTRPLLAAQNTFFRRVGDVYPELLEPLEPWEGTMDPRDDLPPLVYVSAGERAERPDRIAATATYLRQLLARDIDPSGDGTLRPVEPGDIAILFRSNAALREYELGLSAAFDEEGVRFRQEGGGLFYRRPEVVATYRMLRLMLHYPDDTTLSLALGTPYFRDIDPSREEQRLLQYGVRHGHPLTDWFETEHASFKAALDELRGLVRSATVPQILGKLYDLFEIREHLRSAGDRQGAENLERLRELARSMFRQEQALTLRQFLGALKRSLQAGLDEGEAALGEGEPSSRPSYVRLATIHAAKGLEFPIVIIPEVQAPLAHSRRDPEFLLSDGGLELDLGAAGLATQSPNFAASVAAGRSDRLGEEMRLLYVAVTRAQHQVAFVGSGGTRPNAPGDDYYSWKDEIRNAWPDLRSLGAQFLTRTRPLSTTTRGA